MTYMNKIKILLIVSRPLSWIIAPAIWFSGLAQAGFNVHATPAILYAIGLSFPTCLVTFGVNDIYDYASDSKNTRKKCPWTDGTVLNQRHKKFVLIAARFSTSSVILLTVPASLRAPNVLGHTAAFLCLIWVYSSPPLRLKERPVWDSVSNGAICWLFWICGYTFGDEKIINVDALSSKKGQFVLLYASALHSLAALLDAPADSSVNYRTIATVWGEKFSAAFSIVCFCLAGSTSDRWSCVSMATYAGVFTSTIVLFIPRSRVVLVRLAFAGSYLGAIVWVLKTMLRIQSGQDVTGRW